MICKEKRGLETSLLSIFPQYSFLLSLLVVFVHSTHFSVEELQSVARLPFFESSFLEKWEFFFSEFLGQVAVPGFFFVSGYLFFRNLQSLSQWREKLGKRFFSYVLPYLFWNTGMTFLYLLFQKADFSISGIFEGIFLYRYQPVFWYFFQLILLTYACPFFALGLSLFRKCFSSKLGNLLFGVFPLFFLGLVYFRLDIPYLNEDAAFYYSFGGALALLGMRISQDKALPSAERESSKAGSPAPSETGLSQGETANSSKSNGRKSLFASLLLLGVAVLCYSYTLWGGKLGFLLLTTVLYRISTALFLLLLCQRGFFAFGKKYADHNFYLYAVHYLFLRLWFMLQKHFFPEAGEALLFCFYALSPVYCLLLSQATAYLLKKYANPLWRILNGGRGIRKF